jgi:hypothetical protein
MFLNTLIIVDLPRILVKSLLGEIVHHFIIFSINMGKSDRMEKVD